MKFVPTFNEMSSLAPAGVGALVLFVLLGISIPPGANWLMAGIVAIVAHPIIYMFSLASLTFIRKLGIRRRIYFATCCIALGILLSSFGYYLANLVLYFNDEYWIFLCSGLAAATVMATTVNNQINQGRG